jgi:hypothetical protein
MYNQSTHYNEVHIEDDRDFYRPLRSCYSKLDELEMSISYLVSNKDIFIWV